MWILSRPDLASERRDPREGERKREKEKEVARERDQDGYTYYTRVSVQREGGREVGWCRGLGRTH